MVYFVILFLFLYLSFVYDIQHIKRNRYISYIAIQLILILFAGLRYRIGGDTLNYIFFFYHEYPDLPNFSFSDYPIGQDPLYVLINSIVKSLGGRFYWVQLIQASFVIILTFKYFKRHTRYIFTCALFFYFFCYTYFCMEVMRASMSIVVSLYANDYIMEKKWVKGYLLYYVAILFHIQAVVLLAMPLFFSLKFDKRGLIVVGCAFLIGLILKEKLSDYLMLFSVSEVIDKKAGYYAGADEYNSGGNLKYFIVYVFPQLAYAILCIFYFKIKGMKRNLEKIQPFIMLGLIFLVIQSNFEIAMRYAFCYVMYLIILYSECFVHIATNNKKVPGLMKYVRTSVFFAVFFFLVGWKHYRDNYSRFIPYFSVIDRKIDTTRENLYNKIEMMANINEY